MNKERLIKSSLRVKEHGEVFTPTKIVKLMLNQKELQEDLHSLTSTFLEPAAGEGAFLTEILRRKLKLAVRMSSTLFEFEENSLIALSSLYGIELLEDNVEILVLNMFGEFYRVYQKELVHYQGKASERVLESAKLIVNLNIAQGDALKRTRSDGKPIVFSEWQLLPEAHDIKRVQRTEYTLDAIAKGEQSSDGIQRHFSEQLDLFPDDVSGSNQDELLKYKFVPVNIKDVYKQKTEPI
ncbi:DNA methyltransferase [Oenococcus sicerae]|uniref:site-specific DNA-methyltransferase (adenine-specific) n=1 Tax=Oenococcus sicerae TaxID=2203724 RepID=A0AAJ1R992_9LACO|nr:DNA methyltransferase [Oenococcus sicerae]MDN6899860.1 DNA methyltransferase [Oenococcus sicerae]